MFDLHHLLSRCPSVAIMISRRIISSLVARSVSLNHVRLSSSTSNIRRTPLYDCHLEMGAKMVPFCGWEMPLQYPEGILTSHLHTRRAASIFDVSHMQQLRFTGKDRIEFLEILVAADVSNQKPGVSKLTSFCLPSGGLIDDTVVTVAPDGESIYVVVNAGCAEKDLKHIEEQLAKFKSSGKDMKLTTINDRALIAIQGPSAAGVVANLFPSIPVSTMPFMTQMEVYYRGSNAIVTRCGYTGEDGFEISVAALAGPALWKYLSCHPDVLPAGLGARDSLRLEAGLCLYGNDIDENFNPVEAGLAFTIPKARRSKTATWLGAAKVVPFLENPALVERKRVGMLMQGPPARGKEPIYRQNSDDVIGHVSSGGFSPCLKQGIAMGYVSSSFSKVDTPVDVLIRNKKVPAIVSKMPFVPTSYFKGK